MAALMQRKNAQAGGCFLTLAIPIGFFLGLGKGNPLGGSIIGLAVGAVLALLIWLFDRRRRSDDPAP